MTTLNEYVESVTKLPYTKDLPSDFDRSKMGCFEMIDFRAGDVKIMWDRTKAAEVEAAKATFDTLKKKGYAFFKVKNNEGDKGDKITEFDPTAERIIAIAPMAGG